MRSHRGFDPFREHPFRSKLRFVLIAMSLALAFIAPAVSMEFVEGASGDVYRIYDQHKVWRAVGPALSVRYQTERGTQSSAAAEAADLLPRLASRADSARLRYVIIRATRPIARFGNRLGLYRAWNFRYERADDGWVSSGYW
jgi:hypothetical protein